MSENDQGPNDTPEEGEALPDAGDQGSGAQVGQFYGAYYEGPLPLPSMLQQYNEIVPGSAKQIIDQATHQSAHRMRMEERALDADVRSEKRGQWFGFTVIMVIVAAGVGLILAGKGAAGLAILLPGLATLAAVFAYSQVRQGREAREKRGAVPLPEERRQEVEGRR